MTSQEHPSQCLNCSSLYSSVCRNCIELKYPDILKPQCAQHKKALEFYCDSCSSVLCSTCFFSKHRDEDHEVLSVEDEGKKRRSAVEEKVASVESKISERWEEQSKALRARIDNLRKQLAQTERVYSVSNRNNQEIKCAIRTVKNKLRDMNDFEIVEEKKYKEIVSSVDKSIGIWEKSLTPVKEFQFLKKIGTHPEGDGKLLRVTGNKK